MPDDVSLRAVVICALAIGGAIVASIAVAFMLLRGSSVTSVVKPAAVAASPALQSAPAGDFAAYRAAKQRQLSEYAWVDRDRGIVRIPIERAMEILARRPSP
jgi:hypothetical protein